MYFHTLLRRLIKSFSSRHCDMGWVMKLTTGDPCMEKESSVIVKNNLSQSAESGETQKR